MMLLYAYSYMCTYMCMHIPMCVCVCVCGMTIFNVYFNNTYIIVDRQIVDALQRIDELKWRFNLYFNICFQYLLL